METCAADKGFMRTLRLASVCVAVATATLASGAALAKDARPVGAPKNLHGFLLKPNEPTTRVFARTPAFAWSPVRGAQCYEFQLATSRSFSSNSVIWSNVDRRRRRRRHARPSRPTPVRRPVAASDPVTDPKARQPRRRPTPRWACSSRFVSRRSRSTSCSPGSQAIPYALYARVSCSRRRRARQPGARRSASTCSGRAGRRRSRHRPASFAGRRSRARRDTRSGSRRSRSRSRPTRTSPISASCTSSTATIRTGGRASVARSRRAPRLGHDRQRPSVGLVRSVEPDVPLGQPGAQDRPDHAELGDLRPTSTKSNRQGPRAHARALVLAATRVSTASRTVSSARTSRRTVTASTSSSRARSPAAPAFAPRTSGPLKLPSVGSEATGTRPKSCPSAVAVTTRHRGLGHQLDGRLALDLDRQRDAHGRRDIDHRLRPSRRTSRRMSCRHASISRTSTSRARGTTGRSSPSTTSESDHDRSTKGRWATSTSSRRRTPARLVASRASARRATASRPEAPRAPFVSGLVAERSVPELHPREADRLLDPARRLGSRQPARPRTRCSGRRRDTRGAHPARSRRSRPRRS